MYTCHIIISIYGLHIAGDLILNLSISKLNPIEGLPLIKIIENSIPPVSILLPVNSTAQIINQYHAPVSG